VKTEMKVILVNGSPHEKGSTYTALNEVGRTLNQQGIKVELFWLGSKPISGCIGCGACMKLGKCFMRDQVNEFLDKAADADGFVFGSPVHFAAATGMLTSFMDRVFYVNFYNGIMDYKPAAAVMTLRRGGATATLDQLNKYFMISNMPVVSSQYWNMAHGNTPEEIKKDLEGMQTMRTLGKNMAWLLNSIKAAKGDGINPPEREPRTLTNFIR
jgi:multimeric flavodoxin WrbA